jgi:glutaminyl-peptide cyclotransferase
MTPASSVSVPAPVPAPPKPLYLRGPVIAGAVALAAFLLLAAAYATRRAGSPPAALLSHPAVSTRFFSFDLVREYPHDPAAFTQVLSICASLLFSSLLSS